MFKDRYELRRQLGSGATGRVFLAFDRKLNKNWAVKEIRLLHGAEENDLNRTCAGAEFTFLRTLDHEALPGIVDLYDEDGILYIVMDYVEGENMRELKRRRGKLKESEVISTGLELCDILSYLHTLKPPVLYRDMKPSNVIRTSDGRIKLVDLGGCIRVTDAKGSPWVGTRKYAPPEAFTGGSCIQSDIYSLGATLRELTGGGESRPLKRVLDRCLKEEPGDRYDSALSLKKKLEAAGKWRSRAGTKAAGIMLLLIVGGLAARAGSRGEEARETIAEQQTVIPDPDTAEAAKAGEVSATMQDAEAAEAADTPEVSVPAGTTETAGSGAETQENDPDTPAELCDIRKMQEDAAGLFAGGDEKGMMRAIAICTEAEKRLEDIGKRDLREDEMEELRSCRIEDLSMLSAIYKLLGRKNASGRKECYGRAAQYIEELFSIKGVRESPLYCLKLSDLVSIKDELGERDEALKYLRDWEKDNPEGGKELYFTHALLLLREPGNKTELGELYRRMKEMPEVREDFRYRDIRGRIEGYLKEEAIRKEG